MLQIRIFRCGGMDTEELELVNSFEEAVEVIKSDISDLTQVALDDELEELNDLGWYLHIGSSTSPSSCDSIHFEIRKGWYDDLYINFNLVQRLNELWTQ